VPDTLPSEEFQHQWLKNMLEQARGLAWSIHSSSATIWESDPQALNIAKAFLHAALEDLEKIDEA